MDVDDLHDNDGENYVTIVLVVIMSMIVLMAIVKVMMVVISLTTSRRP